MLTMSCNPVLLELFGPFSLHIYGIFISLATLFLVAITINHADRQRLMSILQYERLVIAITLGALGGARLLHVVSEWYSYHTIWQMFALWSGGLSILGALIGGFAAALAYLSYAHLPRLAIFDLAAHYLPFAQAIGRLGCLFAGCCFGCPSNSFFTVMYTHCDSHAPLYIALHPTQLYSAAFFIAMGIFFYLIDCSQRLKPGQLCALYLMLASLERFLIDFLRADRIINTHDALIQTPHLSLHQWISIGIFFAGLIMFLSAMIQREK